MAGTVMGPIAPQHSGNGMSSTLPVMRSQTWATSTMNSYSADPSSDESGAQRKILQTPKPAMSAPKPPRLKTSPSHGSINAARSAIHGRLHKRAGSTSSSPTSPQSTAFPPFDPTYTVSGLDKNSFAYKELYEPLPELPAQAHKPKIRPLLKKLGSQEGKTSLDLNRSVAENEEKGIYISRVRDGRGGSDGEYRRPSFHGRTQSGTSQVSTMSNTSARRSSAQYVHPMRQLPRPYTPPVTHPYQSSISKDPTIDEGRNEAVSYAPLPATRRTPPPLHIRTYSASRLTSHSQTNLPGTPSSLRNHTDYVSSPPDPMPITSRSSFESVFRTKRSRNNTIDLDPAAQLVAVQALRAEFNAREAAKDLKYQQAQERAQEREVKRKERRDESQRRKSEAQERRRAKSNANSEKSVPLSTTAYDSTFALPLETELPTLHHDRNPRGRKRTRTGESKRSEAMSKWSMFWFNFKTMWIKFKRSVSASGS
ncbi:MAG: hypothetical protein MMC33_005325 [Icmadophila ericetorum]|nr:hypothetical protein [Icmadophila ericetorum]